MKKRALSLILVLCLVLTMIVPVFAAVDDITGHWAEDTMREWASLGLFGGDGNGNYRPNSSITRAEFFTLVNRWKGYTAESGAIGQYKDVSPDKWYYHDIAIALEAGYLSGTSATTISPEAPITREQAMAIVARIGGLATGDTSVLAKASDGNTVSDWAGASVAAVINEGLVAGSDGKINPLANITRAETVVLLDRVRTDTRTYAFAGTYGPSSGTKTVGSVAINAPGVVLQNMTVRGDLTVSKGVGDGEATLNHVAVQGKLNVLGGGLNSIYLNNCTIRELIIEKDNVRVVLDNGSEVSFARMGGNNDIIELKGNTKIETLTVVGGDTVIAMGENVSIGTANLNAKTTITGTGTIATANINANGCTIETKPANTNVGSGITANVGGQNTTGAATTPGGGSGGGGGTTVTYRSHNVADKTVSFGTAFGDLQLPSSVTLTANTGATGTADVAWNSVSYDPNTAGAKTVTGTLSNGSVTWAPATIAVTITVQAALTVNPVTVPDVVVPSTDSEAAAQGKLPQALTLILSDGSTVQVSVTWTVSGAYSNVASAENTFSATISGLPASVHMTQAVTAKVIVAASDTPEATTVVVTATPGSVQRPDDATDAKVVLSAVVKDQFGDAMASESVTYSLIDNDDDEITYGLDSMIPTVTITQDSTANTVKVRAAVASKPTVTDEVTIYISDDPVVATSIEVTDFVSSIVLPASGTTAYKFAAVIKDQNGAVMGESVAWSLKAAVAGVSIAADGTVTVTATAANGASFIVVASYTGIDPVEKAVTVNKAASVATSATISGDDSIALPTQSATSANTKSYTVEVKDQYGMVMGGATATWSITATTGVTIDAATGVLSVDKTAAETSVTITAAVTGIAIPATKTVSVVKEAPAATAITVTDMGTGNIFLPAILPTPGANVTRTFTATVTDQYGDPVSAPVVTWSVTSVTGVSITGGVLTVTSGASPGSVTVTATSGAVSGTASVTMEKAASELARLLITGPDAITPGSTGTYLAAGADQYGVSMAAGTIIWSIDPAVSGVSVSTSGVVSVGGSVAEGTTFAVKATSGAVSESKPVEASNISRLPQVGNLRFVENPTTGIVLTWDLPASTTGIVEYYVEYSNDNWATSGSSSMTSGTAVNAPVISMIGINSSTRTVPLGTYQFRVTSRAVAFTNSTNDSLPAVCAYTLTLNGSGSPVSTTGATWSNGSQTLAVSGTFTAGTMYLANYETSVGMNATGQVVATGASGLSIAYHGPTEDFIGGDVYVWAVTGISAPAGGNATVTVTPKQASAVSIQDPGAPFDLGTISHFSFNDASTWCLVLQADPGNVKWPNGVKFTVPLGVGDLLALHLSGVEANGFTAVPNGTNTELTVTIPSGTYAFGLLGSSGIIPTFNRGDNSFSGLVFRVYVVGGTTGAWQTNLFQDEIRSGGDLSVSIPVHGFFDAAGNPQTIASGAATYSILSGGLLTNAPVTYSGGNLDLDLSVVLSSAMYGGWTSGTGNQVVVTFQIVSGGVTYKGEIRVYVQKP